MRNAVSSTGFHSPRGERGADAEDNDAPFVDADVDGGMLPDIECVDAITKGIARGRSRSSSTGGPDAGLLPWLLRMSR